MKLNFKEWNVIYEVLTEKARNIASDLKWHEDWAKEHETDEDEQTGEIRARLNAVNSIIKKLESCAI